MTKLTFVLALSIVPALRAESLAITLNPVNLLGAPGSSANLGFNLSWLSGTDSIVITNSYLLNQSNPLLGAWTDNIGSLAYVLGPSTSAVLWSGVAGSYIFDPNTPIGDENRATLAFDYIRFDGTGGSLGGTYEAQITFAAAQTSTAAPEPSQFTFFGCGLALILFLGRRRLRNFAP